MPAQSSKQTLLDEVAHDIVEQRMCSELEAQATQLVPGSGNPNADIVFIGEAPGKNEDQQGIPFVGAAGKFLQVMLESIGLDRTDVFITNIVKYRPPDNRDPTPAEKAAFWPFLLRQLEIIEPKVIVTLGRHSMEYFLPDQKISDVHGEPRKISFTLQSGREVSWTILPLYHPAAALYNGSMRQTLLDDFTIVKKLM